MKKLFAFILISALIVTGIPMSYAAEIDDNIVTGDVDGDNQITIKDATLIQKHIVGFGIDESKKFSVAADFDGNGIIDVNDATLIQKYLANCEISEYLFTKQSDYTDFSANNAITFENCADVRAYYNSSTDFGTALITSKAQYTAFAQSISYEPEGKSFDEEFFKENALVVCVNYENAYEYTDTIKSIDINSDTLYVTLQSTYEGEIGPFGGITVSPMMSNWYCYAQVKKSDVLSIKKIESKLISNI